MSPKRTLLVAAACLAAGLLGQLALQWHLDDFRSDLYPPLAAALPEFPRRIEAPPLAGDTGAGLLWQGVEHKNLEAVRERLPYDADGMVWRRYQASPELPPADLYLVHTHNGDDRKHHPEVCIGEVTGAPEDPAGRKIVLLGDDRDRPVQRFRFRTGASRYLTVYYWHYSLEPAVEERLDVLQTLHRRLSRPAPSVTAQVSLLSSPGAEELMEQNFLPAVDVALHKSVLPASARMGCDRLPVVLVR